jgi:hypothetical protein
VLLTDGAAIGGPGASLRATGRAVSPVGLSRPLPADPSRWSPAPVQVAMGGMRRAMGGWVLVWTLLALALVVAGGVLVARVLNTRYGAEPPPDSRWRLARPTGSQRCLAAVIRERADQPGGVPEGEGRTIQQRQILQCLHRPACRHRLAVTPLAAIIPGAGRPRARLSQGDAGLAAGRTGCSHPGGGRSGQWLRRSRGFHGAGDACRQMGNWEAVLRAAGAASALPGVVS